MGFVKDAVGKARDVAGDALGAIDPTGGAIGSAIGNVAGGTFFGPGGAMLGTLGGGLFGSGAPQAAVNALGGGQGGDAAPQQPQQQAPRQPALQPAQQDPMAGQRFGHQAPGSGGMTQAPQGFDFRSPGVGEQYFNQQQGAFQGSGRAGQQFQGAQQTFEAPGQGEQYWNQVAGKFNEPRATQQQYEQFQAQPDFGAYYDRAKERTLGSMNDQLAARGVHGGSAGVDMIGQALTDLEAQRANREADYNLQAAQTGGQLAQAADAQRLADLGTFGNLAFGAQDAALNRALSGIQAGQTVDQADLSRAMSGMQAASTAQGLRRQRGRDYMSDLFAPTSALAGLQGQAYQGLLGGDQALLDAALGLDIGRGREALNQDYRRSEKIMGDAGALFDMGKTAGLI